MIDDTAMATKQITSKLDMLEKIVKGKPNRFLRNRQQTETSMQDQSSTKVHFTLRPPVLYVFYEFHPIRPEVCCHKILS